MASSDWLGYTPTLFACKWHLAKRERSQCLKKRPQEFKLAAAKILP
jgi:hypothetical protein